MEDIKSNIINGNWTDAVKLCATEQYLITDVVESIMDDPYLTPSDALRFLKVAFAIGFIQEHFEVFKENQ